VCFRQEKLVQFEMPEWLVPLGASYIQSECSEEKMALVLRACEMNIQKGGGPFAAAIFERSSGSLVSLGVNLVTSENLSCLHAEMVAITLAQRKIGSYDLGFCAERSYQLVSSTEPCAMCLGAIVWSGVSAVITGASDKDARDIGFDEGPKPDNWKQALEQRGIEVEESVLKDRAKVILKKYSNAGGPIYNSRGN